ncbi:MAG: class I SAM-dependent methyltransferase [Deltaproteobacteria bacterium]|nr:class I SAM-dependent methyltransferase [Deltaproteobacteria bacterium]
MGATVFALDLSRAVEPAFANNRDCDNVHVVQADVFNPPFASESLDVVFSIGVLHHTPSAKAATESAARLVKPGGLVSIHLYRRRNLAFETTDRLLRLVTTRLSPETCWKLSAIPTAIGKLFYRNRVLYAGLNAVVAAYPSHHHNYDWYSPVVATHHTEEEVKGWLRPLGFGELADDSPFSDPHSYYARIYPSWGR